MDNFPVVIRCFVLLTMSCENQCVLTPDLCFLQLPNAKGKMRHQSSNLFMFQQMHGSLEKSGGQCDADFHSKCDATNAAVIILKRKSAHKYSLYKVYLLLRFKILEDSIKWGGGGVTG